MGTSLSRSRHNGQAYIDTYMRDAVEAGFVEAYSDHQEALEEYGRRSWWEGGGWVQLVAETERKLELSREQVKVLWS